MRKLTVLFFGFLFVLPVWAEEGDVVDPNSLMGEVDGFLASIAAAEQNIASLSKEAEKAKDTKWLSCVKGQASRVSGYSQSATQMAGEISSAVSAGNIREAQGKMINLRQFSEVADEAYAQAQACERSNPNAANTSSVARVPADAVNPSPVDENTVSSDSKEDSVTAAMTSDNTDGMVTELDTSSVSGSDMADAAGQDGSDMTEAPSNSNSSDPITGTSGDTTETPEERPSWEAVSRTE